MALKTAHSVGKIIGPQVAGVEDVNGVANPAIVPAVVLVDGAGNASSPAAAYPTAADGTAAVPVTSSSGNVANAAAVATLAAAASKTTYITSLIITGAGATAGSVVLATLAGVIGGTMTFVVAVPAGAAAGLTPLVIQFPKPIPASAVNTAITLTLPALGAGNTNAAVVAVGYQL